MVVLDVRDTHHIRRSERFGQYDPRMRFPVRASAPTSTQHPWSSLGVVETLYDDANDIVPAPLLAEVVETSEEFEPLEQSAKLVSTVIHVVAWTYLMPSLCLDNVPTISKYP